MFKTLAASVLFSFLVVGCAKPKLDDAKLTELIKSALKNANQESKSINCPKDIEQKEGATFECTGETVSGLKFVVKATQKEEGKVAVAIESEKPKGEAEKPKGEEKPKADDDHAAH